MSLNYINTVEKFYSYVEWLVYIVNKVLKPAGYKLTGTVDWQGEDNDDIGIITVTEEGNVKSQNIFMAPKWKVWTELDIIPELRDCFQCRYSELNIPNCACKSWTSLYYTITANLTLALFPT